jgi:hypothetical protein
MTAFDEPSEDHSVCQLVSLPQTPSTTRNVSFDNSLLHGIRAAYAAGRLLLTMLR